MRINQFIARATGLSRRAADQAVTTGRVSINGRPAALGSSISSDDIVALDGRQLSIADQPHKTIMLNKPAGYIVSRDGQGSKTIYDLLPAKYHHLKPVGRLDKDSSGLLLLTDDGQLANQLTHPRYTKAKVYQLELDKPLTAADKSQIERGVRLNDGMSELQITNLTGKSCTVTMTEGRNRQIRRTFASLGYTVIILHRRKFGEYELGDLPRGRIAACA